MASLSGRGCTLDVGGLPRVGSALSEITWNSSCHGSRASVGIPEGGENCCACVTHRVCATRACDTRVGLASCTGEACAATEEGDTVWTRTVWADGGSEYEIIIASKRD